MQDSVRQRHIAIDGEISVIILIEADGALSVCSLAKSKGKQWHHFHISHGAGVLEARTFVFTSLFKNAKWEESLADSLTLLVLIAEEIFFMTPPLGLDLSHVIAREAKKNANNKPLHRTVGTFRV